ncbi:hypothetical protein [Geomicrobium sediminis]|uniref:Deoxyxylulose-5-phosphate synthase n=1 Tax=Geomicrobium sediminis TaxID=1347788 RepID=A0ABS2PFK2_9BACL|nr:hypothetical protein [Geomicrobium sediminis]MBM7634193.1 deoxyxylulose-5-phosphate synthase [Geomicrobium sediminis]
MSDRSNILYQRYFEQLQSIVGRIVQQTSQSMNQSMTSNEKELHQKLLHRLLQKVKKELIIQETVEDVNLDYDPTDVLAKQGHDLDYIITVLAKFRVLALQEVEHELRRSFVDIERMIKLNIYFLLSTE